MTTIVSEDSHRTAYVYCVLIDTSGQRIAYLERPANQRMPLDEMQAHRNRGRFVQEVPVPPGVDPKELHDIAKLLCTDQIKHVK